MKLKSKLTSLAAGLSIAAMSGGVSAGNLGEVWTADQANGILHIFMQSDLNDPSLDAMQDTIDLNNYTGTGPRGDAELVNTRMHISGFTNHPGQSEDSRAVFGYLGGQMQIWKTAARELVGTYAVSDSSITEPPLLTRTTRANSLHMCGPSPDSSLIACSSIGNGEFVLFDMDVGTDTYTRIGNFPIRQLEISKKVKGVKKAAVEAVMADIKATPVATATGPRIIQSVCNNFDTDSKLLYVTIHDSASAGTKGGVLVVDVSNPRKPAVRDGVFDDKNSGEVRGYGCGLLNSPDGKYMFTNVGHKTSEDVEGVLRWKHANAYDNNTSGPVDSVEMSQEDNTGEDYPANRKGDAHGAEFAGLGSAHMWQVQRVDDNIQVLPTYGDLKVVNKITVENAEVGPNPAIDVIDRSALGTKMYVSTRGVQPITAIPELVDTNRTPSVIVLGTLFGYEGWYLKQEGLLSGNTSTLPDGTVYDTSDPHGLKSLSYITGGF